jgi:hypothetical protein
MAARLLVVVACSGCAIGGGGAVGYGNKRGFYAGGSVTGGVTMGQLTMEMGGTQRGMLAQFRLEGEFNQARLLESSRDRHTHFGARAGVGYAYTENTGSLAALVGPDVARILDDDSCANKDVYVGIEYRWVGGESQVVLAPRYENLNGLCFD